MSIEQSNEAVSEELHGETETSVAHKLRPVEGRTMLATMLAIALGAAVGANLRYGLTVWAAQRLGTNFPYGTMIINVLGSFAIGLAMIVFTSRPSINDIWRLVLVTGLLGGFTTFSAFSYETYGLLAGGNVFAAVLNIVGSVGLGMVGVITGAALARLLL